TNALLALHALVIKAVLHLEGECSSERIEPVNRVVGNERHTIDGQFRDEIPVDGVAEHFIDAHTILIDRQSLRRPEHRRGNEPTVVDVELKWVAGLVTERDPGQALSNR